MGTNPFDDEEDTSTSNQKKLNFEHERRSNNPFETKLPSYPKSSSQSNDLLNREQSLNFVANNASPEDRIWAVRNVEWPIPCMLPSSTFNNLFKASRALLNSGNLDSAFTDFANQGETDILPDEGGQANSGGYTNSIAGLMSRVLNNTNASSNSNSNPNSNTAMSSSSTFEALGSSATQLSPPNARCVAASNGWIVTLAEHTSSINTLDIENDSEIDSRRKLRVVSRWNVYRGTTSAGGGVGKQTSTGKALLGEKGEMLFPLPHPLTDAKPNIDPNFFGEPNGSIAGLFVDPTGCHVFISAYNGEAYYLHSNFNRVKKLPGFGPGRKDADGSNSVTGNTNFKNSNIHTGKGLKTDSFVTAVAWDKERGTEGNSKRILLGTNLGEIYEYNLAASDGDDLQTSQDKNSNTTSSSSEDDLKVPVLLHVLNPSPSNSLHHTYSPTLVSGLHFERNQGNIVILAVTSGNNKPTLLYSFRYQTPNIANNPNWKNTIVSFQTVFSSLLSSHDKSIAIASRSKQSLNVATTVTTCNEIGGPIDFADLKVCQDAFMIRVGVGIYYGNIDKVGTVIPNVTTSNSIATASQFESGLLPYSSILPNSANSHRNQKIPVSIALTPHHFIALSYDGTVSFINRVSRKPIQKEPVDWSQNTGNLGMTSRLYSNSTHSTYPIMELMMDVRRPDQVWLRQGQTLKHINSSQEDRDVWRYTLEKSLESIVPNQSKRNVVLNASYTSTSTQSSTLTEEKLEDAQFEIAKSQCSNATQKAVVGLVRAEFHLARGRSDIAAKHFAQAHPKVAPFSSTALRLLLPNLDFGNFDCNNVHGNEMQGKSNSALIIYLMDKFRLAAGKRDSVQCTMLGAWLVELYLHEKEVERSGYDSSFLTRANDNLKLFDSKNARMISSYSSSHSSSMTSSLKHVKIPSLGSFLANNFRYLDAQTIIRILASHDVKASECSGYAAASGNIKTAVNAALSGDLGKAGAMDALRVLNDAPIEIAEPYYYKHASTLLSRAPMQSARSFLARYPHGLSPTALLPAFMYYERRRGEMRDLAAKMELEHGPLSVDTRNDPSMRRSKGMNMNETSTSRLSHTNLQIQGNGSSGGSGVEISLDKGPYRRSFLNAGFVDDEKAVVKYLEGVIKLGCQSTAIYNYLISLYASMDDEGPLFRFLSANVPTGSTGYSTTVSSSLGDSKKRDEMSASPLDMAYALRLVLKTGRHFRSAVKLYMGFGLRQQAVELALKVDPALARELARESIEKDERKRLWLMIARNAASNEHGKNTDAVAKVVSVIKDCGPDVLSIEDVLPFLPDFAQIDQFKDEICSALTSYSSKIDQYLKEMNDCDQTCDGLRDEISRLRSHDMELLPTARCAFTHKLVLNEDEPFYVFPSGFVALEGPLQAEVSKYLNEEQKTQLDVVENELKDLEEKEKGGKLALKERSRYNDLQMEKGGYIAAECPFTGSIMVESIDKGFSSCLEEDLMYEL